MILCPLAYRRPVRARNHRPLYTATLLLMLLGLSSWLGAQPAKTEVVGHWVAANKSQGGIGSMWEFKPDGTLVMSPGVVVDMPYRIDGDKLILPPGTTGPDAKPLITRFRVDGDALYQRGERMEKEVKFVRLTKSNPHDPPIVGKWKALVDESEAKKRLDDLKVGHMAQAFMNATYTYTSDGVCKLRVPFTSVQGTYSAIDSTSGTFTVASKEKLVFAYRLVDGKLYLTQPDDKSEDVYVKDDNE